MVSRTGIEPVTPWLRVRCSTSWANGPQESAGTPGGIRTPDLRIRSPSLYPAELQAHVLIIGVRNGDRTRDIRNHNPALYQLSYSHHKAYKLSRYCQLNNFITLYVKRPFVLTKVGVGPPCSRLLIPTCHTINTYLFGTPGGIRTPDLRIRSPLLYPAELLAQNIKIKLFQSN